MAAQFQKRFGQASGKPTSQRKSTYHQDVRELMSLLGHVTDWGEGAATGCVASVHTR